MTLSSDILDPIAAALVAAHHSGMAANESPWADVPLTAADAYALQESVSSAMGWDDAPGQQSFWKAGGPHAQSQPTYARLPAVCIHPSPARLVAADYHRLGIEIEVAFRLAKTLTAGDFPLKPSLDAASLFDAMTVSIELVDFRWKGCGAAPAMLRLADLQSHAALVLGDWVPIRAIDWAHQIASLEVDGAEVGRYEGSHPCLDPLWAATQWAQHAVARHGELAAGSVVTTGSWCGMVWLDGPAHVVARFDGIGETALTLVPALDVPSAA